MQRNRNILIAGLLFLAAAVPPVVASRAELEKPYLSTALQQKLQALPYGLTDQLSLVLRYRHVEEVHFYGAGMQSRFSFKRGQSVLPEGMSMRLIHNGKASWANGEIKFTRPVDLSKYNSIVVWAWASQPDSRILLSLKGNSLGRAEPLPKQGFTPNEPTQLVIPFSRFLSRGRVDMKKITELSIEFGPKTTGTPRNSPLQILGIAFVKQKKPVERALLVLGRSSTKVVLAEPLGSSKQRPKETVKVPVSKKSVVVAQKTIPTAVPARAEAPVVDASSENASSELVLPYTPDWPLVENPQPALLPSPVHPHSSVWKKMPKVSLDWLYFSLLAGLVVFWVILVRRRQQGEVHEQFGKVLHEIHWPFSITQPVLHKKVEREFWKGVATQQERFGWLSTTGLTMEKSSPNEYFGEPFLKRQIELAASAGITLFPSLSFTNSFFRRETSGTAMERTSSALRALITETILRFAESAEGVRIENATDFLGGRLRRRGRGHNDDDETVKPVEHEFWSDVIRAVRVKNPSFIFMADSAGDQFKQLREVGFDYYENDLLRDTVMYQIRVGKVGDLKAFLSGEAAQHLWRSIYNLTPLIKSTMKREVERHQSALCALLLSLIPGVVQHDSSISEELVGFINRLARTSVIRRGRFALMSADSPEVLAFGRWHKKTLLIAVANFSNEPKNTMVSLKSVEAGFEMNKLYLFNNALHGAASLRNLVNQPEAAGPALAFWGQNLRDGGLPLVMPPLSLGIFSVAFTKPLVSTAPSAPAVPENESTIAFT